MPEPETRTRRPKIATAERREARVPDRKGTRGASQASRRANRTARQGCLASTPRRLGAPLPLVGGKEKEYAVPAREGQREGERWLPACAKGRRAAKLMSPSPPGLDPGKTEGLFDK